MTYAKMDPDVKVLWLEALRSGKYTQGRGSLRTVEGNHCCLGVLADQLCPTAWNADRSWSPDPSVGYSRASLSHEVREEISLDTAAKEVLIDMNDTQNSSFEEIANWIEKNL